MVTTTMEHKEIAALQALKGATLKAYSGYRLFDGPSVFFGRVRLEIDGRQVDIVNRFRDVAFGDDGSTEEVGILSIGQADGPIWLPDGEKVCREKYGEAIDAVFIIEDTVRFMNGDEEICVKKFSQAIVLQSGDCFIGFDKGAWFDEYVTVARGNSIEGVIRDCSEDWVADEPIWNEFSRSIREL